MRRPLGEWMSVSLFSEPERVELTVLMPCLDEAETIEVCVNKAKGFLERYGVDGEVLIADNGSSDGSQALAEALGARVVSIEPRGYGNALYWGTRQARGKFIIMGDADDSYDFSKLGPFVDGLRGGADMVMGNRFKGGIRPGAMPLKNKYLGNPVLSRIGRTLFSIPIGDFHCGLRGFSRSAFNTMDLQTTGMEYASEMVIKATLLGLRIDEVPTTLDPDGRSRPPHLRPWRDGWRHLRFMFLYSPRWTFIYPGMLLMGLGGVGLAVLLPGPLQLGVVGLDVHTLLFAALAVILGFQALAFGVAARTYAVVEGLLPENDSMKRLWGTFQLETGLIAGSLLFFAGLAGALVALGQWQQAGFGALDPSRSLRVAIAAVTGMGLGGQVIFTSLLLSILGLKRRHT